MLLKEMLEEYQNDVAYNLPFGEVTLTGARQVYFEIRAKYVNLAARARDDFTKEYETYESTREMVSRTYLKFYTIWDDIVEETCKDLVSIGYYELDESTLYKISVKRGCTRFFDDAYQEIKDEVSDIKEELTNRENYREEQKNSRGRWVGSTFGGGILNAYAHQAKLGMMNAASGAAYNIVNAIGNAADEKDAVAKIEKIYQSKETKETLQQAVFMSIFSVHLLVADILNEGERTPLAEEISQEQSERAQRLCNNIQHIPEENRKEVLVSIFELDPKLEIAYEYALLLYGDEGGTLEEFGHEVRFNVAEKKEELISRSVRVVKIGTQAELKMARDSLPRLCQRFGATDEMADEANAYLDSIQEKLEEGIDNS